jgi:hypothetical protein
MIRRKIAGFLERIETRMKKRGQKLKETGTQIQREAPSFGKGFISEKFRRNGARMSEKGERIEQGKTIGMRLITKLKKIFH